MKQTKKEILIEGILKACKQVAKEPITDEEKATLKKFTEDRLHLHGRSGYLFYTVQFYQRVYIHTNFGGALELIAEYILKCNHKTTKSDYFSPQAI